MLLVIASASLMACQTIDSTTSTKDGTKLAGTVEQKQMDMNLLSQLSRHHWQLVSAVDAHNKPMTVLTALETPASLTITDDALGFGVNCNTMGAQYQLNDNILSIDTVMSTQMYCADLDEAERKLSGLMQGDSRLSLFDDNQLIQKKADGSTLTWQGKLTDEAKYLSEGGKVETIFLEVVPKLEDCVSGKNQRCLKVRKVYYDANGVQTGTGEWRLFNKAIKGYTHSDNLHQILRVKKYITDAVDVKGKQLTYVLDMVVMSEVVSQ